jgi:hypothetical protein
MRIQIQTAHDMARYRKIKDRRINIKFSDFQNFYLKCG